MTNDTIDCAYTWMNKFIKKDAIDCVHCVIVAWLHTSLSLISMRHLGDKMFFLLFNNNQVNSAAVLHPKKNYKLINSCFFLLRGNRCFEGFKLRRKLNHRADVSFLCAGFLYHYCASFFFF